MILTADTVFFIFIYNFLLELINKTMRLLLIFLHSTAKAILDYFFNNFVKLTENLSKDTTFIISSESFSKPLMQLINYTLDEDGQMMVNNQTALYYCYPDIVILHNPTRGILDIKRTIFYSIKTRGYSYRHS